MSNHILGVHWIPAHNRNSDLDYMRALQPSSIKIIDPDVTQIARAHAAAPNALIVLRNHPRSEQHSDVERDPEGTGRRHAQEWGRDLTRFYGDATLRGLSLPPTEQLIVLGINEPRVWTALDQVVRYEVAFLRECTALGIRAGALNLSVGWPANHGTDMPADWKPYAPILPEIKRGRHYLFLHEYFDSRGALHNWRWWCGRYEQCPWDVPIIIGECGLDQYVSDPSVAKERRGWHGWYKPVEFVTQLYIYAQRCAEDGRIVSIQPFTTDSADTWQSFETQPAHGEILAKQWPIPKKKAIVIPREIGTHYVTATILNVRNAPHVTAENPVVRRLRHGDKVKVTGWFSEWAQIDDVTQWAHGAWLSQTKPEPLIVEPEPVFVEPEPVGDNWSRIFAWILKWEGGWADHPSDPGGATMRGITIGTYTRWREAQGQPKPTKDDLRNISVSEVEAIYREWYWKASGADQLKWPLNLAVMDTAVNAGVGRATDILARSDGDFVRYMGILIDWYTRISNFEHFGRAWIRRRAEILLEAAK